MRKIIPFFFFLLSIGLNLGLQAQNEKPPVGSKKNPHRIKTAADLDAIRKKDTRYQYYLVENDITDLKEYIRKVHGLDGWLPIGTPEKPFEGYFDGGDKIISGFWICRGFENNPAGLFGVIAPRATVEYVNLQIDFNEGIIGGSETGAIAGINRGLINYCTVDGAVIGSGLMYTGGIAGVNQGGIIRNCSFEGKVKGDWYVGGITGYNYRGVIEYTSNSGKVEGEWCLGGIAGIHESSWIEKCYNKGSVSGEECVGGIIGLNANGTLIEAYSDGKIKATDTLDEGAVIGTNWGGTFSGGIYFDKESSLKKRPIGYDYAYQRDSFYSEATEDMMLKKTFTVWDFELDWDIDQELTTPFLRKPERPCLYRGRGTADDPYRIRTAENLDCLREYCNEKGRRKYFKIMNDINLSDYIDEVYPEHGWEPIGGTFTFLDNRLGIDDMTYFSGYVDGGGFEIQGLKINKVVDEQVYGIGLFGRILKSKTGGLSHLVDSMIDYCTLKNIHLTNVDINVKKNGNDTIPCDIGGLVGTNDGGIISHCSSEGKIYAEGLFFVGGLVGSNELARLNDNNEFILGRGEISYCSSKGQIQVTPALDYKYVYVIGGLVGHNFGHIFHSESRVDTIKYIGNEVEHFVSVGGFVGRSWSMIKDCYARGNVICTNITGLDDVGVFIGEYEDLYFSKIINCYGSGKAVVDNEPMGFSGRHFGIINNTKQSYFDKQKSPYLSGKRSELGRTTAQMQEMNTFENWDFMLTWAIKPNEYPYFSTMLADRSCEMAGTGTETDPFLIENPMDLLCLNRYMGAQHEQLHFRITQDMDLRPLINATSPIRGWKPLGPEAATRYSTTQAFHAKLHGDGHTLSGLWMDQPGSDYLGLFRFLAPYALIDHLKIEVDSIKGGAYIGALAGESRGTLRNITISGDTIRGASKIGGIAGSGSGEVIEGQNHCPVISTGDFAGGLFGVGTALLDHCTNTQAIQGKNDVGGLIGTAPGKGLEINNSLNTGAITGKANRIGGLIGSLGSIDKKNGEENQNNGLIGFIENSGSVENSKNEGKVSGREQVGGLLGYMGQGGVNCSENTGEITAIKQAGGIAGVSSGIIRQTQNTQLVSVQETSAGGIVGEQTDGQIQNCINNGSVKGQDWVGGITGESKKGSLQQVYNTGIVKTIINNPTFYFAGGITGSAEPGVSYLSCFYDTETCGRSRGNIGEENNPNLKGKSTLELKQKHTFTDWNFSEEWGLAEGMTFPLLRCKTCDIDQPLQINGPASVVELTTNTYTVQGGKQKYLWTVSGGEIIGSTDGASLTILWAVPGEYTLIVSAQDSKGCYSLTSPEIRVSVKAKSCKLAGDGSIHNPYQIKTPNDLDCLREFLGNAGLGKHFRLEQDIDLGNFIAAVYPDKGWEPIGGTEDFILESHKFKGFLHGNGKKIQNLWINRPEKNNIALFKYLAKESVVDQLHIEIKDYIKGGFQVGALAAQSAASIQSCIVSGAHIIGSAYVGGLIGESIGIITDCHNQSGIRGVSSRIGGITGQHNGRLEKCTNTGEIEGYDYTGGITGEIIGANSVIDQCKNKGAVSGNNYVGGIANLNVANASLLNSDNNAKVVGETYVGGLVGIMKERCMLENSFNSKAIYTLSGVGGGLAGRNSGGIISCSYNSGDILLYNGQSIGGLVGEMDLGGVIEKSYNKGALSPYGKGGGLVGVLYNGEIHSCHNEGSIYASADTIGGLIGVAYQGKVTQSYSSGTVGKVAGLPTAGGGIVGWNVNSEPLMQYSSCYFNTDKVRVNEIQIGKPTYGVSGLTTAQMLQRETYSGWNFTDTWRMAEGFSYPRLFCRSCVLTVSITGESLAEQGAIYTYTTQSGLQNLYWEVSSGGEILSGQWTSSLTVKWNQAGEQKIKLNARNAEECYTFIPAEQTLQVSGKCDLNGDGTVEKPYQIKTARDLDCLREYLGDKSVNKHFQIMNNIDLESYIAAVYPEKGWEPIGLNERTSLSIYSALDPMNNPTGFSGILHGNGHTISGLWSNQPKQVIGVGLFTCLGIYKEEQMNQHTRCVIENLTIELDERGIEGWFAVGGLSGGVYGLVDIQNCTVKGGKIKGQMYVGGLIGSVHNPSDTYTGTIQNSRTESHIESIYKSGGFLGKLAGNVIINCCQSKGNINSDVSKKEGTFSPQQMGGFVGAVMGYLNTSNECQVIINQSYSSGHIGNESSDFPIISSSGFISINDGTINSCFASGDVYVHNTGGFVNTNNRNIKNGYYSGKMHKDPSYGFAYSNYPNAIISNCYFNVSVNNVDGIYSNKSQCTILGISGSKMQQEASYSGWDFTSVWAISEGLTYPQLKCQSCELKMTLNGESNAEAGTPYVYTTSFGMEKYQWMVSGGSVVGDLESSKLTMVFKEPGTYTLRVSAKDAKGCITYAPVEMQVTVTALSCKLAGDGTVGKPYQIKTAHDLNCLREYLGENYAGKHFQIMNDIDLNEYLAVYSPDKGWEPIGGPGEVITADNAFRGYIHGGDRQIQNLWINRPNENNIGLFKFLGTGSQVDNLDILVKDKIVGNQKVGVLAGVAYSQLSGISTQKGFVKGNEYIGGIAGFIRGKVQNSHNESYIGTIEGVVENRLSRSGGITGFLDSNSTIVNCTNTGTIQGGTNVGGIAGIMNSSIEPRISKIESCSNSGLIEGYRWVGGIIGLAVSFNEMIQCNNSGTIKGSGDVGGLIGEAYTKGLIQCCFNTGSIFGKQENVGGLAGRTQYDIYKSYNSGTVTSTYGRVGGLVGVQYSDIFTSYNTGDVKGKDGYVGGITGIFNNGKTMNYCYNIGEVTCSEQTINNSVGSLSGYGTNAVYNACYFNIETSKQTIGTPGVTNGITGLTTSQMLQISSYEGWNFDTDWVMAEGLTYPQSRCKQVCELELTITGETHPEFGITYTYSTQSGMDQYLWTVEGGNLISGQGATHINVVWTSGGNHSITLTAVKGTCLTLKPLVYQVQVNKNCSLTGNGMETNPYQIKTAKDLNCLREYLGENYAGKHFQIMNDIDLKDYIAAMHPEKGWEPIGGVGEDINIANSFRGLLHGSGYQIQNLTINRPDENNIGLFKFLGAGSVVENLDILLKDKIVGNQKVGVLAGVAYSQLSDIKIRQGFVKGNEYIGGIAGFIRGKVQNSRNESYIGTIEGVIENRLSRSGGITGFLDSNSTIVNCTNTGTIQGGNNVGGIAGIMNSSFEPHISKIKSCSNSGVVEGYRWVGGAIGLAGSYIQMIQCDNSGTIKGSGDVGGLIGEAYMNGIIECCYNTGTVLGKQENVGGLAGRTVYEIHNSYNSGTIRSTFGRVGGLVGVQYSDIYTSYNTGDVNGKGGYVGGITGIFNNGKTMNYCYNIGEVTCSEQTINNSVGSLSGYGTNAVYNACYFNSKTSKQTIGTPGVTNGVTGLTTSQMLQISSYEGWNFDMDWVMAEGLTYPQSRCKQVCELELTITGETHPEFGITYTYNTQSGIDQYLWTVEGGNLISGQGTTHINVVWTSGGNHSITLSAVKDTCLTLKPLVYPVQVNKNCSLTGSGTETNPYQIKTAKDLDCLREYLGTTYAGKHFRMMNDIDLKDYIAAVYPEKGWEPIRKNAGNDSPADYFMGNLNGGEHKIINLYINRPDENIVGLFKMIYNTGKTGVGAYNSTIENLGIHVDRIIGGNNTAALTGGGTVKIVNCYITGGSIEGKGFIGGFIGSGGGEFWDCYNELERVSGEINIGGLAGNFVGSMYACKNKADIEGFSTIGGLVGHFYNVTDAIQDCNNYGKVNTSMFGYTGGIAGIIGTYEFNGRVESCHNFGEVSGMSGTEGGVGGITGRLINCSMINCTNQEKISMKKGSKHYTVSGLGGLVGYNDKGKIECSYNHGEINCEDGIQSVYTGGLVGIQKGGIIRNCYNKGKVVGGLRAGGLVGQIFEGGSVYSSYNTGEMFVSNAGVSGGFVGFVESGTIRDCYSSAPMFKEGGLEKRDKGFAGSTNSAEFVNCYYNNNYADLSGVTSGGIYSLTNFQMKQQASYSDWNFDTDWVMAEGLTYPQLRCKQVCELKLTISGEQNAEKGSSYIYSAIKGLETYLWSVTNGTIQEGQGTSSITVTWTQVGEQTLTLSAKDKNGCYTMPSSELKINVTGDGCTLAGSGTNQDPFHIKTAKDLDCIREYYSLDYYYYYIIEDIDLSTLDHEWIPIGSEENPFNGYLGGYEHKIKNLKIESNQSDVIGLFAYSEGFIEDVNLEHVNIGTNGPRIVGTLVGINYGRIFHCSLTDFSLQGNFETVGGLVGINENYMGLCKVIGLKNENLFSYYYGGLVGINRGEIITSCVLLDDVFLDGNYVGGLVGMNNYWIEDCYVDNYCDNLIFYPCPQGHYNWLINMNGTTGGLIGLNNGPLLTSYSTISINGPGWEGALIGLNENRGSLFGCFYDSESGNQSRALGENNHYYDMELNAFRKSTKEMTNSSTFTEYFNQVGGFYSWTFYEGMYPKFEDHLVPNGRTNELSITNENTLDIHFVNDFGKEIKLYPNPTTGKVKIETEGQTISEVEIYTNRGQFLFKTDKAEFDLSPYPKGIYVVRVNGRSFKVLLEKR